LDFSYSQITRIFLFIWGAVKLSNLNLITVAEVTTSNPIAMPDSMKTGTAVILGYTKEQIENSGITWENLVIHLAIFMIIFFAMSEIVAGFSSFSETVSWVIGFGMALIAGASKMIGLLAAAMGLTAGIGAIGIMIIILAAIGAAVILNLGIGGSMRTWRMKRQVDIKKHKVAQGFETAAAGVRGAKTLAEAGAEGEE
jgi:hypothetical protein